MAHYLVFARKYRPADFDEVVGQDAIVERLREAVRTQKVAHAYLFSGPRGVGKTTCARILARCLNCQEGPTPHPCGACPSCREIARGGSFDVLEIDAASNRGIDEIRTLRENVKFAPGFGRYKVYIIDEVHMLTTEAFNALLKTLEEPPEHVKFVLATTDPQKLPETVISRCQRFDFKRANIKTLVSVITRVCSQENLQIDDDAVYAVAKAAEGSVRDALSILDQLSALSERRITAGDVSEMLGVVEKDLMFALVDALVQGDMNLVLRQLDEIVERGKDMKQLNKDLIEHMRNMLVLKIGGKKLGDLVDEPGAVKQRYWEQGRLLKLPQILDAVETFIEAQETARITETWRIPLELAFARLLLRWHPDRQDQASVDPFDVDEVVDEILQAGGSAAQTNETSNRDTGDPIERPAAEESDSSGGRTTPGRGSLTAARPKHKDPSSSKTKPSSSEKTAVPAQKGSTARSGTSPEANRRRTARVRRPSDDAVEPAAAAVDPLGDGTDDTEDYTDADAQWGGRPPETLALSDVQEGEPAAERAEQDTTRTHAGGMPDLEGIKRMWPALTRSVSRHKMSLATLLQEGVPVGWDPPRLTVSFDAEHEFHKETVEERRNKDLIEKVFTEELKTPVRLKLRLGEVPDEVKMTMDIAEDDNVDDALKEFKGTIVNRWHNET